MADADPKIERSRVDPATVDAPPPAKRRWLRPAVNSESLRRLSGGVGNANRR